MGIFAEVFRQLGLVRYRLSRHQVLIAIWAGILLLVGGMLGFRLLEGWSLLESLYTAVITATTVGYGDFSPQTPAGQIFGIVFALTAVGIAGYAISALAASIIQAQIDRLRAIIRERRMQRIAKLQQHIIVCGGGHIGSRIARDFRRVGKPFILIEGDEALLKKALLLLNPDYYEAALNNLLNVANVDLSRFEEMTTAELADELDIAYIHDDPTNDRALAEAGIGRADGLITALPDDRDNLSVIVGARALSRRQGNDALRIVTSVSEARYVGKMHFSGANEVMAPEVIGGSRMAHHMLNPVTSEFYAQHMRGEQYVQFREVHVAEEFPGWVGQTVEEVHRANRIAVLAIKRDDVFLEESPPLSDTIITANDILIIYAGVADTRG